VFEVAVRPCAPLAPADRGGGLTRKKAIHLGVLLMGLFDWAAREEEEEA
jgi:hypothetical protein